MATQSTPQFFAARWKDEMPRFARVLRALPNDKLDYKPHDKCTPAGNLGWQIAVEAGNLSELLDNGVVNFVVPPCPASNEEIASTFEKNAKAIETKLGSVDEAKWSGPAKFNMNGQTVWETTVEDMFWGYIFDMVHHRGQLAAYIRPMGGKVPSIYGPSADDSGE
ncbi:MAG TPA: DinB family protein [Thermoanaerobaculia bacterium]|jgi:hypothetical protein|nr:DinB family protein [Thermoanaerobaculia bacterium]